MEKALFDGKCKLGAKVARLRIIMIKKIKVYDKNFKKNYKS